MSQVTNTLLERAQAAIEAQSWQEAWSLLQQIDHSLLGSKENELLILAATVLRHRGEVEHSERLYGELKGRMSLKDERLADVVMGLAECAHLRGHFTKAAHLAQAARRVPVTTPRLQLRMAVTEAHIRSHVNVDQAILMFNEILHQYPAEETTLWAHLMFQYADALFVAGDIAASLPRLIEANRLATETGATIAAADSMRRLPLVRVLLGQGDYALRGVNDLSLALNLYEVAGDRGSVYLYTEAGEVHRALGKYREAERSFTRGLWGAREIDDENRMAHNQLGLFEVSRAAGAPKWRTLDEAAEHYLNIGSEWGRIHTLIARALADRKRSNKLIQEAMTLATESTFSKFPRERELLTELGNISPEQIERHPHIMNYP
jgi:tetratricopeptide (TPR) repeat protein